MSPFKRYQTGEKLTPDLFKEMCKAHDLTYSQSDDMRYYRAGKHTMELIEAASKSLGNEVVVPIWNSVIDTKLANNREQYYWRLPK